MGSSSTASSSNESTAVMKPLWREPGDCVMYLAFFTLPLVAGSNGFSWKLFILSLY